MRTILALISMAAPCALFASGQDGRGALALQPLADGLVLPVGVVAAPGDAERLFVIEQRVDDGTKGRIRIVDAGGGGVKAQPFLEVPNVANTYEEGLLGLVFHPDYQRNGYLFVYFTTLDPEVNPVPPHDAARLERYQVDKEDPGRADPRSRELILAFPQPSHEHKGGWLAFGSDGLLYLSSGDGGPALKPSQASQAEADDPASADIDESLMGRVLRLDPDKDGFPDDPFRNYAIPADNPFAGSAQAETWLKGLRNPWRASFDRQTGDLWMGDVGNVAREEIDLHPASAESSNFGWPYFEGDQPSGFFDPPAEEATMFASPVFAYPREVGGCVTGGYVYRGNAMPWLRGSYFYADYAMGWVRSFRYDGRRRFDERDWTKMLEDSLPSGGPSLANISSFGEDANGELCLVDLGGQLYRIVPAALVPSP